jgi:diguanylate cyclase (GGDEF)-like protein
VSRTGRPSGSDNGVVSLSDGTPPAERGSGAQRDVRVEPSDLDEQALSELDQSHSDSDQTASDHDQSASDADQSDSYSDQERADLEQGASDRDQAAADRESEINPGSDASRLAYETSRAVRAGASATRQATAIGRATTALDRTQQAARRDQTALLRDLTASARDLAAEARDRVAALQAEAVLIAKAAMDPAVWALAASAEEVRSQAAADRARAASDRERAAADRAQAAADRRQARVDLQGAHFDALTGAYVRDFGRIALQHVIERSLRSGEPFVLGFVDVDGLKALNDSEGHAAGDVLLQTVGNMLKSKLRPYDPIVRVGGDEFLCGLTNTSPDAAALRFEEIRAAIEDGPATGSITVGLASLVPGDTLDDITARADLDMYAHKAAHHRGA